MIPLIKRLLRAHPDTHSLSFALLAVAAPVLLLPPANAASFTDANWVSMGGISGVNGTVRAAVVDGSGNLYIGGEFTIAGDVFATNVARWNGSTWSALGLGMNSRVRALAILGNDLYAGGEFTTAGGTASAYIAKWDATSWSTLSSGMNGAVIALAVSGNDLYAGGGFTAAGGVAATNIAKWDGTHWSALGFGIKAAVSALAVLGSDLYAGGGFSITKWNGSSWSRLDLSTTHYVTALAVSGTDLYAAGIPRRRAESRPTISPNGTVALGARSAPA